MTTGVDNHQDKFIQAGYAVYLNDDFIALAQCPYRTLRAKNQNSNGMTVAMLMVSVR